MNKLLIILALVTLACTSTLPTQQAIVHAPLPVNTPTPPPGELPTAFVAVDKLNLRECPGTWCTADPVGLVYGEELVLGTRRVVDDPECPDWVAVLVIADGRRGWVCAEFMVTVL